MFSATIILCAFVNGSPDYNRCMVVDDTLGPYTKKEECINRVKEMLGQTLADPNVYLALAQTLKSGDIRGKGKCEQIDDGKTDV